MSPFLELRVQLYIDQSACDRAVAKTLLDLEQVCACLIIMKGMANYEGVSDVQIPIPIIHILRAKCAPVAASIGVPQGTNAVFAVLNGRRMGE